MNSCTLPMTAEQMLAEARRIVGVDIVDTKALEPLTVLINSLNKDGCLHEDGVAAWHRNLLRMLSNRLRMQRDFLAHPEIADQPILPPVFIWGMFRTGTTKLHKLLSASGDFNWLPFWKSLNPCLFTGDRNESTQPRIDDADSFVAWWDEATPTAKLLHQYATHQVEEETHIMTNSLRAPVYWARSPVVSYLEWLRGQDPTELMSFIKDTLKYLQWQGLASSDKPWVLKSPIYLGLEEATLKVFPDATFVMNHRSPAAIIPSVCATLDAFLKPYTAIKVDHAQIVAKLGQQLEDHQLFRDRHPELDIHDINYRDLEANPLKVIADIYAYAGMKLTDETVKRLTDFEAQNPRHKHGTYKFTLKDFNLTEDDVHRSWSGYFNRYGKKFGFEK